MNAWSMQRVRVLVEHADPLVYAGLLTTLRREPEFDVRCASDAADGPAEVIVTDYAAGLRRAVESRRGPRVLIVTPNDREHEIRIALESGVHGYLLLGRPVEELAEAVRTLGRGLRYLALEVSQRMADSLTREQLTGRETQVLRLLARGLCNKSIAQQLDIGLGTVKAHVRGILAKLEASSRTEVVSIAVQRGLIEERSLAETGATRALRGAAGWEPRLA